MFFSKMREKLGFSKTFELAASEPVVGGTFSLERARKAKQNVLQQVQGIKEVQGVGIAPSEQGYSIKVNLSAPLPKEVDQAFPREVCDVPVRTYVTGRAVMY